MTKISSNSAISPHIWGPALILLASLASPAQALAQTGAGLAEVLYDEGRQLFTEGRYDEACPKLAQSDATDPGGGTVLLLGICLEKQGKFASAWTTYKEAVARARKDGRPDREKRAAQGIEDVKQRVSHLIVTLPEGVEQSKDMRLSVNGQEVPLLAGVRIPIDPGAHRLMLQSEAYEPMDGELVVDGEGQTVTWEVPPLERKPPPPPAPVAAQASQEPKGPPFWTTGRAVGLSMGVVGLASVGVGSYFGVQAINESNKASSLCPPDTSTCSDLEGVNASNRAADAAMVSNILIGAGALVVAGGVVVWFLDSPKKEEKATAAVSVKTDAAFWGTGGSLRVYGTF